VGISYGRVTLTRRGRLVADQVSADFA
jgi:hypothetical protein